MASNDIKEQKGIMAASRMFNSLAKTVVYHGTKMSNSAKNSCLQMYTTKDRFGVVAS